MKVTKEMIEKAKHVTLDELEPTVKAIVQIAMHVRDHSEGLEEFVKPTSDTWQQGFQDAMYSIVRFIMLAHISDLEQAWNEFPDLN